MDEVEFELNKPGWYETQNVLETDFDPDQYNNQWFSVKFTCDAGTHLWLAKEKPEEHKKYYGHFEKTKSGKAYRFKRDKVPEDEERPANAGGHKKVDKSEAYLKDASTTPIQIYNGSLNYAKEAGLNLISDKADRQAYLEYVKEVTDELLDWIDAIRNVTKEEGQDEA